MIEKVFYNVFIFGTIISICISPLLIFLYKNKYKYKLKNIYKVFIIVLLFLILPVNCIDFSSFKNKLNSAEKLESIEPSIIKVEPEIILETTSTIIEVNDSINIKNNNLSNFAQFVPYLWISISIIFLSYNLISYWIYIYKNKKNCIEIRVPEIEEKIIKICNEMKLKNISYAFSKSIATPMVVGIFKKKIMLPENILKIENYEMILMHEIVHIKNKDIECKFILLLINSIYWFNPVIYKFIDQVEEVLELKCDEIVLENRPQIYKIKYAQVLLNQIEENRNLKYRFSLNFANKRRNIMKRFSNIVEKNKKKNMIGVSCIVASAIIISSAIIFSFPNINFATIQEEAFNNEVDNNLVVNENVVDEGNTISENTVVENVIDNNALVEDNDEVENEVTNSTETKNVKAKVTEIEDNKDFENINTNVSENNSADEDCKVKDGDLEAANEAEVKKTKIVTAKKVSYDTTKEPNWNLIAPTKEGTEISSYFGKRGEGIHTGIDFKVEEGQEVYAVADGGVIYSGYKGSYGYLVIIDHGYGLQTYYAHNSKLMVNAGEKVKQGDLISKAGATGNATGPTLHFETRINGVAKNPLIYLP